MYIKVKYIDAISSAIDFITNAVDGANEDAQEQEMLGVLRELEKSMKDSRYKYHFNKFLKQNKLLKQKK